MIDLKKQQKLESLYRDYKDDVFNYLYRISADYDLAMDITQITFTKAFQDAKLTDVTHIKAYLLTIGRNALYDEWKRKKEVTLSAEESALNEPADDPLDRPLQQVAQADMQGKVESTITLMKPHLRELMILRYTEGLSIREIALITQRTESDVKVSLHRARIRFERDFEIQMYSRVAKSRDRCDELNRLLAPYEDRELPAETLKTVDKHLASCDICEQDKQTMKRQRELFAALPLIPAPLALDERMADVFHPGVSAPPEDQTPPTSSDPGISTVSAIQTTTTKWLAGVTAAAILGGAATILLKDNQPDTPLQPGHPTQPAPLQPGHPPQLAQSGTQSAQSGHPGKVTLTATNAMGTQLSGKDISWKVYQMNGQARRLVKNAALASPTLELPAGDYQLVVNQGPYVKQEVDLTVKEGVSSQQSIVLESGRINLSAQSVDNTQIINKAALNKIQWKIYANSSEARQQTSQKQIIWQYGKSLSLALPPGPYTVVAKLENAETRRDIEVSANQLLEMTDFSFAAGKLVLAARRTAKGPVIKGVRWRITQLDENNKERIIETRHGDKVSFILPPGTYHAQARYKNSVIDTEVVVTPGKTLLRENIILGSGTLQLSSRLSPDSPIQKGVRWQVFTSKGGEGKKIVASKHGDTVNFDLPQGQYHIVASYKKAQASTEVVVMAGKQARVDDLILDAGVVTLRSRLSPDSPIQKGVRWTVYSIKTDGNKDIIASQHGATVSFTLPTGKYQVKASYAKASTHTEVTVLPGKEIKANDLILNAGVVTLRSRLSPDSPIQKGVRWTIYALKADGKADGNKDIIASQHGDTVSFTLPTGRYQVQASYGKARAKTEVEVVAGKSLNADEVLLNAGRLILSSNLAAASLKWQVYQTQKDGKRKLIISKFGAEADVVLPVGDYRVSAGQGKEMLIKEVGIIAGKIHRQRFDMKK